jgi:hypothetical protein
MRECFRLIVIVATLVVGASSCEPSQPAGNLSTGAGSSKDVSPKLVSFAASCASGSDAKETCAADEFCARFGGSSICAQNCTDAQKLNSSGSLQEGVVGYGTLCSSSPCCFDMIVSSGSASGTSRFGVVQFVDCQSLSPANCSNPTDSSGQPVCKTVTVDRARCMGSSNGRLCTGLDQNTCSLTGCSWSNVACTDAQDPLCSGRDQASCTNGCTWIDYSSYGGAPGQGACARSE